MNTAFITIGFNLLAYFCLFFIFLGQIKTTLRVYKETIDEIKSSIKKINDELGDIDRRLSRLEGKLLNNPDKNFKTKKQWAYGK